MKLWLLLSFVVLALLSTCWAHDMSLGTSDNKRLIWQEEVHFRGFPLQKSVKQVFYSAPDEQTIAGIIARDLDCTEGSGFVSAGGVGSSYVNIVFQSQRGYPINYEIKIYV